MAATIDLDLEPARELAREVASRLPDVAGRLPEVASHLPDLRVPEVRLPDVHLSDLTDRLPGLSWSSPPPPPRRRGRWLALLGVVGMAALVVVVLRRRGREAPVEPMTSQPADSAFESSNGDAPRRPGAEVADLVDAGAVLPPPFLGSDPGPDLPVS